MNSSIRLFFKGLAVCGRQWRSAYGVAIFCSECMEPELQHLCTSYTGIDVLVRRSIYKAVQAGELFRVWGSEFLGFGFRAIFM